MGDVHLFTTNSQPFTRYRVEIEREDGTVAAWWRRRPRMSWGRCINCGKRRRAYNLRIKLFYDGSYVFCADKKKCP